MNHAKETREQKFLRIGRACNFKCKFCNISAHNESRYPLVLSLQKIKAEIKKINKEASPNRTEITISGGEPSLFQREVLCMLAELRQKYPIEIQTNASKIDRKFAEKLAKGGVSQALVSFHGIDKKVYENLLGVDHAELKTVCTGMRHLLDVGISVTPNLVMTRLNLFNLIDTLKFLIQKFPELEVYNLAVFQPHGDGELNQAKLAVPFQVVKKQFDRAIKLLEKNKKVPCFHFCSLPPCFFSRQNKRYVIEYRNYHFFRKQGLKKEDYRKSEADINASQKVKKQICDFCFEKNFCGGLWPGNAAEQVTPNFLTYKDF